MKIGVIGVQGAVSEHIDCVRKLGAEVIWMRTPDEVDAVIIPGGESTTITNLMQITGIWNFLKECEIPIMGTCAGLIVLAKEGGKDFEKTGQPLLSKLNCKVDRNAFGRQRESFEADIELKKIGRFHGVFIRAPAVVDAYDGCDVLATFEDRIIAVEQGNVLGLAFHPELANDLRLHKYFLSKVRR